MNLSRKKLQKINISLAKTSFGLYKKLKIMAASILVLSGHNIEMKGWICVWILIIKINLIWICEHERTLKQIRVYLLLSDQCKFRCRFSFRDGSSPVTQFKEFVVECHETCLKNVRYIFSFTMAFEKKNNAL
jgi:hypothetical protein